MIYLLGAFLLSPTGRAGPAVHPADAGRGTVPLLSFLAEHRAAQRVRAEHPELA